MAAEFEGIDQEGSLRLELSYLHEDYFSPRQADDLENSDNPGEVENEAEESICASTSRPNRPSILLGNRGEDVEESEAISSFVIEGCGCNKKNGEPCSKLFSQHELEAIRSRMLELSSNELDLVVLAAIATCVYMGDLKGNTRGTQAKANRDRGYCNFCYHGQIICKKTFLFLYAIGTKRYNNLLKHYHINGISPRTHGNEKRRPWHAASFFEKERAVAFIKNYADVNALPLPGRLPKHQDYKVMLLPSDVTKRKVYNEYSMASSDMYNPQGEPVRIFGYREFCRLWAELVPYITVMLPSSDLCFVCQQNANTIMRSANLPEDEKSQRLKEAEAHLAHAKLERQYYRNQVKECRDICKELADMNPGLPNTRDVSMHISFDYAQQILFPYNPQQPGPAYFKTSRKCQVFGVCCEGNNTQLNYLIDEAQSCGKGANVTTSYVHHYLDNYSIGEKFLQVHCDNCVGQNKNNTTVLYFGWRVLMGLNTSCSVSFMIPGHTKFGPDWFFGLMKRKYRKTRVSSMDQIARVVQDSTVDDQNKSFVVGKDKPDLNIYDWTEHFSKHFSAIPNITSYHHFFFSSDRPGEVILKKCCDGSPLTFKFMKARPDIQTLPRILQPEGLSDTRQRYLYDEIRQFCEEEYKDITCPKPKSNKRAAEPSDIALPTKKPRNCSYCKQPGHTKTKRGTITCPKLLKK